MKFRLVDSSQYDSGELDRFDDRTVYQTNEWVSFLAHTQNAKRIVAELKDDRVALGYFTGLTFRRMGIRILGSPFAGWTTPYMGFNLLPGVRRWKALQALETFAFQDLKCLYMEICDRRFSFEDGERLGFACSSYDSYGTDLTQTKEELFNKMTSACRRCIRKAEKSGVRIEESRDALFADEYYEQLKDVFAKQNLVPTYSIDRVRKLIHYLLPTGHLLLLRARGPNGNCIGTGIYPGMNKVAQFWGNASFRWGQHLRPNEALHWYAMRYWQERGIEFFDWGGGGAYKQKFGAHRISIPRFSQGRFRILSLLRDQAEAMFRRKQRLRGWLQT